jgi:NAD(P)-dependent dehydrogenase (short-subunit alcohol dehydrogenase family)
MCFQELSAALSSEAGKLYPLKCDIIREADIKEAFRWIKLNLGGVDILVNNAGVASENSLMGEQPQAFQSRNYEVLYTCLTRNSLSRVSGGPVDSWRSILEVNVLALSICTKEAIQSMRERSVEDGHIIHMNRLVEVF